MENTTVFIVILIFSINAHSLRDMTVLQRQAVLPLIAILENSVYNASLAHNTIQVLMQVMLCILNLQKCCDYTISLCDCFEEKQL